MASVLDLVKHYQHAIEKYPNDEQKILKCIDKLFNLKVTVQHLQETGVGRTVNALRKEPGEVGQASRALVNKWKLMVAAEESDSENEHNDTANHNGYGNGKDSDENSKQAIQPKQEKNDRRSTSSKHDDRSSYREMNGKHSGSKRRHSSEEEEPEVKKTRSSSDHHNRDSYNNSNSKVKPEPKSESESDAESDRSHSDSSESDMSESTVEEVKIKQEIKTEQEHSKSSKHSSTRNEDHKKESSSKHSHESKSSKTSKHSSSVSKELHRSEKSSLKENNSHKSTKEKESSSEKKHKTDQKERDKKHKEESKSSKHSSSEKHKSSSNVDGSSDKHKSSSQTDSSSDKHKNHNEKHSSKTEKHRSSSQSHKSDKDKHKSSSEKEIPTEKHKSKDRSSGSKEKNSSSSKEKSKDRSSSSKEKSDNHKSEKKHSSSSEKLKSNDKNKDKLEDKSDTRSKHRSSSSSNKSSKSTTNMSTEDIPKKIKQVSQSEDSDDGIDCGSGASFAEALGMGMISPAKPKKKSGPLKDSCSPGNTDLSPAALLAPSAKLAPLPALEISALPEISPHYKPRPPPKLLPHFTDEEAMSSIISSKNQRTKVYSGNKVFGKIPSLYEMCVHILQEHIDALEYTGGVPYEILKPVIDKATPQQLFLLEHYNPYLMEDTDHLWQKFCERHFRKQQRQEMETWREMYMRCQEEQEHKLKSLTENIKIAQEAKKAPIKQTKMAYVDTVVKPPRNIARKQALHGTAHAASASPAARVASLAAAPNVLRGSVRPTLAAPVSSSSAFKPKRAPLMAKALQFMRGRKR